MEFKGEVNGAPVYDDYGHHPTEVRATLTGAKGLVEDGGRLYCVFQPHTYSRTKALFSDFADALGVADRAIVADIYAARETDTLGVSSAMLAEAVGKNATFAASMDEIARMLKDELTESDAAVIMGAGDIYKVFERLDFDKL